MKRMKAIITYLRQLQANNNREWFNAHKDEFLKHQARFHELVEEVIKEISVFDPAIANLTPRYLSNLSRCPFLVRQKSVQVPFRGIYSQRREEVGQLGILFPHQYGRR